MTNHLHLSLLGSPQIYVPNRALAADINEAETLVASGGADCRVCVWDASSGALLKTLQGHTEPVYQVTFGPDPSTLLSCSLDGSIRLWETESGRCLEKLAVESPYAGMNISGVIGLTQTQLSSLAALGATANTPPQRTQPARFSSSDFGAG